MGFADSSPHGVNSGKSLVRAIGFGDCTSPPSNCAKQSIAALKTVPKAGSRGTKSVARIGFGRCFRLIYHHC